MISTWQYSVITRVVAPLRTPPPSIVHRMLLMSFSLALLLSSPTVAPTATICIWFPFDIRLIFFGLFRLISFGLFGVFVWIVLVRYV
jgi:hypothetical protein